MPVIIKTYQELKATLENNPFKKDASKDPKKFYVVFLKAAPLSENVAILKTYDYSPEEYILQDKIIYFYAANSAGNAKMNNNFFEKKLKVPTTTRNWNTIHKLVELSQ